ncbi:MAG: DinB family protein [Vicinamibacterales bacterium]
MDTSEREQLIAQYRDGYRAVAEALLRITPEELDTRPGDDRWTAREVVHHLADSELAAALRIRAILAEDRPTFGPSDQNEYARRLHYDRPHESSLELFRYAREATAEILERLTPADWLREGVSSKSGSFGAERWLQIYAPHAHQHARQIRIARDAAAKVDEPRPT